MSEFDNEADMRAATVASLRLELREVKAHEVSLMDTAVRQDVVIGELRAAIQRLLIRLDQFVREHELHQTLIRELWAVIVEMGEAAGGGPVPTGRIDQEHSDVLNAALRVRKEPS